ncbi:hypothetical protein AVEN_186096-1 [Araneus ventricosus]|uniref:Uncharacterized protein n=1 Tax=Araneus ventricosus TaxID=182803 RepID=A0A4Y2K9C8_ARAVE|nr:hypothetical protein AVEN_186096-1 [Araneus ventricosus]
MKMASTPVSQRYCTILDNIRNIVQYLIMLYNIEQYCTISGSKLCYLGSEQKAISVLSFTSLITFQRDFVENTKSIHGRLRVFTDTTQSRKPMSTPAPPKHPDHLNDSRCNSSSTEAGVLLDYHQTTARPLPKEVRTITGGGT